MRTRPPRALDLFCGAGGASAGLARAGFDVTGIDIRPQPHYPFRFWQGDATIVSPGTLKAFDLIWASPPCQGFTAYRRRPNHVAPRENLIPTVRDMLRLSQWQRSTSKRGPLRLRSRFASPLSACALKNGSNTT